MRRDGGVLWVAVDCLRVVEKAIVKLFYRIHRVLLSVTTFIVLLSPSEFSL